MNEGGFWMKKATLVFALLAFFAVGAYAAQTGGASGGQGDKQTMKGGMKAEKAPLKTMTGTISDDGKSFTDDKDKKQWTIKNPEDVKGHEGHHVKVQAHVYKDTNEIHVMKVMMMGEKGHKGGKKGAS
jgi:hypothetical protein